MVCIRGASTHSTIGEVRADAGYRAAAYPRSSLRDACTAAGGTAKATWIPANPPSPFSIERKTQTGACTSICVCSSYLATGTSPCRRSRDPVTRLATSAEASRGWPCGYSHSRCVTVPTALPYRNILMLTRPNFGVIHRVLAPPEAYPPNAMSPCSSLYRAWFVIHGYPRISDRAKRLCQKKPCRSGAPHTCPPRTPIISKSGKAGLLTNLRTATKQTGSQRIPFIESCARLPVAPTAAESRYPGA